MKMPDRQQPRAGQEDNFVSFRKKHCAGKEGHIAQSGPVFVTNEG